MDWGIEKLFLLKDKNKQDKEKTKRRQTRQDKTKDKTLDITDGFFFLRNTYWLYKNLFFTSFFGIICHFYINYYRVYFFTIRKI